MNGTSIINSINTIAEQIFKSVEGEVFKNLDNFLIIRSNIMQKEPLKKLFAGSGNEGLVILLGSFIIFFAIYYMFSKLISMYNGETQSNLLRFLLRTIICAICSISSVYICEQILEINAMFTDVIVNIGNDLTGEKICFESLREIVLDLNQYMTQDAVSIDGLIKGVISFGATTILISFAVRYVTVIFLILCSPICIMFASADCTMDIFKNWFKMLLINILIQNVVVIILMIPISVKKIDTDIFKIILVGSIYLLYKINNFSKEFLGNISSKTLRRN